ncbi:TRAP transporter small permease [Halobacillus sp. A5]|uniref:TRAP transporter small permease n=1 Tax=Halobacillus sp. A5 TaxID=2880263 RepID=UPI0020A64118|nr:TRAP transporter small permease [Halobacillus sp. A5]MCP3027855.1 TRAP transporter small permease [Halobacillus sp. A5]
MQLVKLLSNLLKFLTVILFIALVIVVLIQITGRYTPYSFVWTEELSRFLFIYAIAVSAPLAMENREYVRVDLLLEVVPNKIRKYVDSFIYLVIGAFSAFLIYYAYEFALLGQNQSSATIAVEMFYINLSMLIIFLLLALYSFINIFVVLKNDQEEGVR